MQTFINYFFSFKFFPSLVVATLLFAIYMPKRKLFWLRLILSFLALSILSVFMWRFAKSDIVAAALGNFAYVLCDVTFFFMIAAFLCFNFKCSFIEAVLYDSTGWCVEHIANSLTVIFALLLNMGVETLYFNYSTEYFVLTVLVYLIVYMAAAIAFWAFCRGSTIKLNKKRVLLPSVLVLFVTALMGVYTPIADVQPNVMIILKLFAIVCCITSLCLALSMFEAGKYRYELDAIEVIDRKRREQYEIAKDTIDAVNVKCHDLKKMIGSVLGQYKVMTEEELKNLSNKISIYDAIVKTGNEALDLILTEKSLYCEQNDIKLTIIADGDGLGFISDADTYSLFGNILDNAVEAVMKLEPHRRTITLNVRTVGGMLVVHEENYCAGEVRFVNGTPVTSKGDTNEHGYGVLSIRHIAEKYGGGVNITVKDGIFSMNVLMLIPQGAAGGAAARKGAV